MRNATKLRTQQNTAMSDKGQYWGLKAENNNVAYHPKSMQHGVRG